MHQVEQLVDARAGGQVPDVDGAVGASCVWGLAWVRAESDRHGNSPTKPAVSGLWSALSALRAAGEPYTACAAGMLSVGRRWGE
jgi:hypothetical protein